MINFARRFLLALAALLPAAGLAAQGASPAAAPAGKVVYSNTFANAIGKEWSANDIAKSPAGGESFMGRFTDKSVSLTLAKLPEHAMVRVRFDLYVIGSWDGNITHDNWGPDIWELSVEGGPTLLRTTFGSAEQAADTRQAYPGDYPGDASPMETGAASVGKLGYAHRNYKRADSIYHMDFTFPHTGKDITLLFSAKDAKIVNMDDESWGLDNVEVSVLPAPAAATAAQMEKFWDEMDSKDAKAAFQAKWSMIAMGTQTAQFIEKKLKENQPVPKDNKIAALIARLDDNNWRVRDQASDDLITMGKEAVKPLQKVKDNSDSLEVRLRAEMILRKLGAASVSPETRQILYAKDILRILKSAQAERPQPARAP